MMHATWNDGTFKVAHTCGDSQRCLSDLCVFSRRALGHDERTDLDTRGKGPMAWQGWMKTRLEARHPVKNHRKIEGWVLVGTKNVTWSEVLVSKAEARPYLMP